jgi:hypothetical protein
MHVLHEDKFEEGIRVTIYRVYNTYIMLRIRKDLKNFVSGKG